MKIRILTLILFIIPFEYFTQIISDKWYEIHNENGLKVDVQLNISNQGCDNGMATLISHRYDGLLYSYEEFATWSVRYIGCDGKAYKYTHSTSLGGSDLISEINLNPEDLIIEEFDDQILHKDILSDTFEEISKSSVKLVGYKPIQLDESYKQFQSYKLIAETLIKIFEPEQAMIYYLKADSVYPNDEDVRVQINKLKKFAEISRVGDKFYNKKQFSIALEKYNHAIRRFPSVIINKKIKAIKIAQRNSKDSLEKYNDKVAVENEQWIEIFNQSGLKIEIFFEISPDGCNNYSTIYKYRYTGRLHSQKQYANWSIEYTDCNGAKRALTSGAPIGGSDIKKELYGVKRDSYGNIIGTMPAFDLEQQEKEEFDKAINNQKGTTIQSIFSFNVSNKQGNLD